MLMPVYLNRHPWAWGLICFCLGLALLGTLSFGSDSVLPGGGQLTTYRDTLSADHDLLQDISNSTLGVGFSPSDRVLILADKLLVSEDLCARISVTDRSSRLHVTGCGIFWDRHRVC
jgi:hypothetical protein